VLPAIYLAGLGGPRYLPARMRVNRLVLCLCSLVLHRYAGLEALLVPVN